MEKGLPLLLRSENEPTVASLPLLLLQQLALQDSPQNVSVSPSLLLLVGDRPGMSSPLSLFQSLVA